MDTQRGRRGKRTQRGAAAVEFALLLPVMMGVIAGITDFGRAFFTQIELTNAAREGARAAVVGADPVARAQAAMIPVPSGFAVTVPSTCPGVEAEVTVSAPFNWMFLGPVMSAMPSGPAPVLPTVLDSTAVMACT